MKFKKQDLLTLLISLFLFSSCETQDGIGLDVNPNDAITGSLVDSVTVVSKTVAEPEISTAGLSKYPIGLMTDEVFGETESSLAVTMVPPSLKYNFGNNRVLDSAILVLKLDNSFYGDTINTKFNFEVRALNSLITDVMSSKTQSVDNTVIGSKTTRIFPNTPIRITDVVSGSADTLRTTSAQIRIPINSSWINSNLLSLDTNDMASNSKFKNLIKGLQIAINKDNSTISANNGGGIAFVNLTGSESFLQLVYRKTNATNSELTDTISVNFPFGSSYGPVAAKISHDYTGTPIESQLSATDQASFDVTYLQGLVGLKTKIEFPYLTKFSETYGKVAINKAELVIDLSNGTTGYPYSPSNRLSLYRWDIADRPKNVPDRDQGSAQVQGDKRALTDPQFGGYYDSLKNRYVFVVTSYVQDLIDKKIVDYGTFIAPTSTSTFELTPTATTAERSVIGKFNNGSNRLKLNIYYTKLN